MKKILLILSCIISAFAFTQKKPTLFLIGDSTMANKDNPDKNPEHGWGQVLSPFLTSEIEIQNHAVNGRSSKSFRTEGRWDKVEKQLKKGDFVVIQFGHNDQKVKDSTKFTNPHTQYRANLERYVKDFLRPVMVSLVGCDQVLLDGPTFQNSPAWNLHPLMCSNVILRNLTVRNPWYSQNGDGVDLESCKNVLIYDNTFDVGDDAICIKSGKDKDGRKRGMPTENVIIKNNIVYHGHGGFVIGSEMSGGARNIHVSDCTFIGTDIGLRFKTTRGRGGIVENIYIKNIDMINIPTQTIGFNMFYEGASPVLEDGQKEEKNKAPEKVFPVTEETPIFRNIFFKNISAVNSYEAVTINGLAEMNIKNIVIEDSQFDTKKALTIVDADGISLKNVKLNYTEGTGAVIYNSKNIDLSTLQLTSSQKPTIKVLGSKTSAVKLPKDIKGEQISISKEIAKNAVK